MRVVKEAEERKNEILDAAERLVRQKEIPVLKCLLFLPEVLYDRFT